jgi:HD-GYP domain-containing protein (c-di-GMP phosphodiesterase class II)
VKRPVISLGIFFSAIMAFLVFIILLDGSLTAYFRVRSELKGFTEWGEAFTNMGSKLLSNQVKQGENAVKSLAGGIPHHEGNEIVLLAAVLDENRIETVLKGWLPEGMILPHNLIEHGWRVNDLLDQLGRNLLSGVMTVDGKSIFAVLDLDFSHLDGMGTPKILPVLSTPTGAIVWVGASGETAGLASHLRGRGLVAKKHGDRGSWSLIDSHYGERVVLSQEPFLYGLELSLAYPLTALLRSALYGAAVSGSATATALGAVILIWLVWRRGIYRSIRGISSLSYEMGALLSDLDGTDHVKAAEAMYTMASRFSGLEDTFVAEMNSFTQSLKDLFQVISRQQEELTAFNEEVEAMNQELENVNNRLITRETLWSRTLEFSKSFSMGGDARRAIASTLHTIRQDTDAFGVLISSAEGDCLRLLEFSGYRDELEPFILPRKGIAASESLSSGAPLWVEDISRYPSSRPVHPFVRSQLLVPLFQSGEEEGVLEVAFDTVTRRDEFLIETLAPVASYLGGLIHGHKMRREIEASYSYLAEKLQFVTGIYHDETENHIARIGEYCKILAERLGRSREEQEKIALFARLHDIGKLKIPRDILSKPGPLTAEEFSVIKGHPEWGASILGDASWLEMARRICLTHHEKWDGSGYPEGIKGDQIPWEGQVAALADVYDALRSYRAYKPPFTHKKAMEIITVGDGRVMPSHFSPQALQAFIHSADIFADVFETLKDNEHPIP